MTRFKKVTTIVLAVSLLTISAAGCGIKSGGSSSATSKTDYSAHMKQRLDDSLAFLVSDGTITNAQEDKIINALTSNMKNVRKNWRTSSGGSKGRKPNGSRPQGNGNAPKFNGSRPQGNAGPGMMTNNSSLQKLVTDNVITQAQLDKVVQALSNGMRGGANGGSSQQ